MYRTGCIALLLAWLAGAGAVHADTPRDAQARAHFSAGTRAFQSQDYAAALDAFRAALEAGLAGPAVHYNIGVCAWQLGRLDEAEAAFLVVADHPGMAATAYYNLGLISQRRGDRGSARAWFERARAGSDDDGLRRLAAAQLETPAPTVPAVTPSARRTVVYAAIQAGYDDNVALVADGEVLGISDTASAFAQAQLAARVPLGASVRLEASGYLLRYTQLEEFAQAGGRLGLVARRALGAWQGELGADHALNQLDGERFEDRSGLSLAATRPLGAAWDVRLRYRFEDISGREPFESLTGDRHEASLRLRRRADGHHLDLEYRYEANDRAADAVSPDRHRIAAEWTLDAPARMQARFGLGWRHSSYQLAGGRQTERQGLASAALLGPLAGRWRWLVQYDWTRNDASAAEFGYTRQRLFAGVDALF